MKRLILTLLMVATAGAAMAAPWASTESLVCGSVAVTTRPLASALRAAPAVMAAPASAPQATCR